ncbi:MAG: response regulator [Rhodocyclaceae bacterium]|nr:response regulator [Rhodocyclaceae bacterium]
MMPAASARRPRILVVDDEPMNLEIVADALAASAYEVVSLGDGDSALRALKASDAHFDLAILDRRMSAPDGMAILRHIRASQRLAGMPVILQTAAADPAQVAEGLAAGADYYLTKPFKGAALVAMVGAALAQRRELEQLRQTAADLAGTVSQLARAEFRFRSVDQASALAHGLAALCAQPDMVRIGLAELLVNAIEHGNLGLGFDAKRELMQSGRWRDEIERRQGEPRYRARVATLSVEQLPDLVRFVITDQGEGFDWTQFLEMPAERMHCLNGRGIALARKLSFLSLNFRHGGREVEVTAAPSLRLRS